MVGENDVVGKVWLAWVPTFSKCCSEFFEGKMNDLVVQVHFVSTMKTSRHEGDLSDADSKIAVWNALVG